MLTRASAANSSEFTGREIARAAEKTQHVKIVERRDDEDRGFDEAEERGEQSQSPIYPLEDDIECSDQHDNIGRKHRQVAGNAESEYLRHRSLGSVEAISEQQPSDQPDYVVRIC
jgi:hypothetical protein